MGRLFLNHSMCEGLNATQTQWTPMFIANENIMVTGVSEQWTGSWWTHWRVFLLICSFHTRLIFQWRFLLCQNNYLIQSYFNTREYSLFYIYSLDISPSSDNFRSWRTFFSRNVCSIDILGDIYHKWLVIFRINFTLLTLFRCGSGSPWQEEYHHVCDVTLPGTSAKCFYGSHPRGGDVTSGSHSQYHPCDNRGTLSDPDQAALLWAG